MTEVRSPENRVRNWNGTVHYATDGRPDCGYIATHASWLTPSIATVTCERCIAQYGADTPGYDPAPAEDPHVAARAAERAARRASR